MARAGDYAPRDRAFIEKRSIPEPNSGCWLWLHQRDTYGYGIVRVPKHMPDTKRKDLAHRISFVAFGGKLKERQFVRHSCDNPPCVNPDHLLVGYHQDNMDDMVARNRTCHGERVKTSKITEDDVVTIIKRKSCGESAVEIASRYNISWSRVYQICRGEGWNHVKR